jgi:hypothetical protein
VGYRCDMGYASGSEVGEDDWSERKEEGRGGQGGKDWPESWPVLVREHVSWT